MINDNQRLSPVALVMFLNLLVILLDKYQIFSVHNLNFLDNNLRARRSNYPHTSSLLKHHTPPQ
jgi:hypothetical protein